MKRHFVSLTAAAVALILEGCLGSGGSSALPPNNVVATAKDSRIVVTWDMVPGVQYWVWKAAGTTVTPQTCSSLSYCTTLVNVSSPATISGTTVFNGQQYAISINSRISGGPGGQGSPAVTATPRMAGGTWTAGNALGANLRGVAYGTLNGVGTFVAVGDGGLSYSGTVNTSTGGITWTQLNNATSSGLNAVTYDATHAKYLGVGVGGTIVALTPATSNTTWSQQTSPTANPLYAIATSSTGFIVATGAAGTIITTGTGNGTDWVLQTPSTSNALYGVTYGYDSVNARNIFVAVGAAGTVLYSVDGVAWTAATPVTLNDLKSVTYGAAAGVFLAVGANGTVLTSSDGVNWATKTTSIPSTTVLNSVTFSVGRRFVAVGNDGNIFYSEYTSAGSTWTQITPSVTISPIYAVATGGLFDYSAVGAAGLNLYSD